MRSRERRWAWYSQAVDLALLTAGLFTIGLMLARWSFPWGALLLVAFCTGGLTAGQLTDAVLGRRKDPGETPS
jgi:hypothetical protein